MMRFAALLAAVALVGGPAVAAGSPVTTVEALYRAEQASLRGAPPPWRKPRRWFDRRLTRLFQADAVRARREGVGNLQFDPLCDGQDCRISQLRIVELQGQPRTTVAVRFRNMGKRRHLLFWLRREGDYWRVAEIVSRTSGSRWKLSAVLRGADRRSSNP